MAKLKNQSNHRKLEIASCKTCKGKPKTKKKEGSLGFTSVTYCAENETCMQVIEFEK